MLTLLSQVWAAEPAIVTVLGSAAFWPLLFNLLGQFGHPLTTGQEQALSALGVFLATFIIRSQVTSPATLQKMTPEVLEKAQDAAQPVRETIKKLP